MNSVGNTKDRIGYRPGNKALKPILALAGHSGLAPR